MRIEETPNLSYLSLTEIPKRIILKGKTSIKTADETKWIVIGSGGMEKTAGVSIGKNPANIMPTKEMQ